MASTANNPNHSFPSARIPRCLPPRTAAGPQFACSSKAVATASDVVSVLAKNNAATRRVVHLAGEDLFCQGEEGRAVFFLQDGRVKITLVSMDGKEAVLGFLQAGDFVGEGCIANQPIRTSKATSITTSTVLHIPKQEMLRVLHQDPKFSDFFISYMLCRSMRIEEDLTDQLFNTCEKRLARALLRLAGQNENGTSKGSIPKVNQETLAGMIGTTRSRVNFFMNKFRKLGFIEYDDKLKIHNSLLDVIQHN
jgi:CRP-like cAMP-binding protein